MGLRHRKGKAASVRQSKLWTRQISGKNITRKLSFSLNYGIFNRYSNEDTKWAGEHRNLRRNIEVRDINFGVFA